MLNRVITYWPVTSLLCGALTTLAFAPFDLVPVVFLTLALMFYSWYRLSARQAMLSGWLFGMGLQSTGVSWIFYSLHTYGSAPAPFAITLILLLAAYLSLYHGLAVYIVKRFAWQSPLLTLLAGFPAAWVLTEWLQGYVMTGFAWMQLGYTQLDTPLSGLAPVLGAHAVSGAIAMTAGGIVLLFCCRRDMNSRHALLSIGVIASLWLTAGLLKSINWTQPAGDPIRVSIIQGNFSQDLKWKYEYKQPTLDLYYRLTLEQQDADLIIWPETAVPDYFHRMRAYLARLDQVMQQRDSDLLLGIFSKTPEGRILNSVINSRGDAYHKRHLVPLGEYIPLRSLIAFFNRFVKIPMSDIASGEDEQPLITAAGVPVGITICFEEAFARDVIKDLPEAQLLVNVSNDAWFEDSHELAQHHTIARMRALESGRYMVRSTNTGITSVIDPHGEVIDQLPRFETAVLRAEVLPMQGATPFVRWGNGLVVILALCALAVLTFLRRRTP